MTAITPDVIRADIDIADIILSSGIYRGNAKHLNMALFHAAQAMEKSIKLFLHDENHAAYQEVGTDHNFGNLLVSMEATQEGFCSSHEYLRDNHLMLSRCNTSRYGYGDTSVQEVTEMLQAARELFSELVAARQKTEETSINKNNQQSQKFNKNAARAKCRKKQDKSFGSKRGRNEYDRTGWKG